MSPAPVMLMIRQLDLGGTERQVSEVARGLDRSRFDVHVGCFHSEGIFGDELRAAGVPLVAFPVRSFRNPSVITGARQMGGYLRKHRIQLVHTFDVPTTIFGVPVARFAGVPRVLSSQRAQRALTGSARHALLRLTDRIVDGIITNCEFIKNELTREDGISPRLIHVCPNGLDLSRYNPSNRARPEEVRDASLVIGTVGVMRKEKGQLLLLEAFARALRTDPQLRLVLVGEGPLEEELRRRARELSIQSKCLLIPATSQAEKWFRGIDIFVLPSLSEALSNSLMEAMACGCAVVASRVGGNPELIQDGETGLLCRPADAADLAGKLTLLLHHPDLRQGLALAAAKFIRQFSTNASLRRIEEIYSQILECPKREAIK